jgi:hypothetical protein
MVHRTTHPLLDKQGYHAELWSRITVKSCARAQLWKSAHNNNEPPEDDVCQPRGRDLWASLLKLHWCRCRTDFQDLYRHHSNVVSTTTREPGVAN